MKYRIHFPCSPKWRVRGYIAPPKMKVKGYMYSQMKKPVGILFQVEILFPTTRNLQICVHVYRPSSLLWRLINFRLFCSDDCRSWPREEKFWSDDCRSWPHEEKINNHGSWGKHAHIPDNDYWGSSVCFMSCEPIFFCNYSYVYIFLHDIYF